jgi:hypothetical protein
LFLLTTTATFDVLAATAGVNLNGGTLVNPLGSKTLTALIADLLKIVAQLGAVICVFFIIYSGFLFIKAQGDPGELKTAKSVFLWSVVGTAVLLGASVVADIIIGTVNSVIGR